MPVTYTQHRDHYRAWAAATFTPEQIRRREYDEAGYPQWACVEDAFAEDARNQAIRRLPNHEATALLFLIARAWDIGRIIAWLSDGPRLSNIAPLSDDDVLFLAEASLQDSAPELDDARYQLATILPRAGSRRADVERLLLRFYECDHEHTKRRALLALSQVAYANIVALAKRSWQIDDEHHRMAALEVLARAGDTDALDVCLAEARGLPGEHLAAYCARLVEARNNSPAR